MKTIFLIISLTLALTSCYSSKQATTTQPTHRIPTSFDNAEKWFDSIHNQPLIIDELPILLGKELN